MSSGSSTLEILGSGEQTRAFCYVSDLVEGLRIMERRGNSNDVFHIGTEEELTIRALAELIAEEMGAEVDIVTTDSPEGETNRRCPDIQKVGALGYVPSVPIEQGIRKTVQWYTSHSQSHYENELL